MKKAKYDDIEYSQGVYVSPHGKLKLLYESEDKNMDWVIDEGLRRRHPSLNLTVNVVRNMQGGYFVHRYLKNCEYLGDL